MSEKIEPALTVEEWRGSYAIQRESFWCYPHRGEGLTLASGPGQRVGFRVEAWDIPALIAAANASLPDSDPRKITRETVVVLRDIARRLDDSTEPGMYGASDLQGLADALESYLPPES